MFREGFVVQPTDLGLASPAMQLGDTPEETREIWRNLAPLYWLLELPELKPGVRVLAEHPTRVGPDGRHLPVFCLQYVGAGKVLFHATDETWRWRYRVGDRYFARYWVQTIRYLCRAKLSDAGRPVVLSTDRREYAQGEPVRLRARFADERLAPAEDDGVTVVAELSGRQTQRLSLRRTAAGRGVFEGVLDRPAPGDYHAWIVVPACEGSGAGGRFYGDSAGGRVRRDPHERRRDASRGPRDRRPLLHVRLGRPSVGRFAARPPGAHRIVASAAVVEQVARAGVVPRSADRRMDITETAGEWCRIDFPMHSIRSNRRSLPCGAACGGWRRSMD